MPTGNRHLELRGRREWVASIFAAVARKGSFRSVFSWAIQWGYRESLNNLVPADTYFDRG
jgi:hypothetical protein